MDSESSNRVRTRGGRSGRGRGVRTRGAERGGRGRPVAGNSRGGRGAERGGRERPAAGNSRGGRGAGSGGQERLTAVDDMSLVHIEDVNLGSPLERPLHIKKRRTWSPSPRYSMPPTAANSNSLITAPIAAATVAATVGSPAVPPSPACYVECGPSPSMSTDTVSPGPAPSPVPSTSEASDHARQFYVECGPSPSMSTDTVLPGPVPSPVPSTSETSDHARQLTRRKDYIHNRRPVTDSKILTALEMGSESESDSDDEPSVEILTRSRQWLLTEETQMDDPPVEEPTFSSLDREEPMPLTASSMPAGPESMYEFVWSSFPDSPIPPESRREIFSQNNVGPTLPMDTPYKAFMAIWDRPIIDKIVGETNNYAHNLATNMINNQDIHPNSRICDWHDTCVNEIYIFLAIILAMGVVIKTRIDEYWNKANSIFTTPGFSSLMSLRRFQLLCKCLHFNDNEGMRGLNLDGARAKLFKIAPVLDYLNVKFSELYVLDRNIAIDESLVQWKGWLNINQVIPNKKARIGIKSYEICESQTGYLWRFEIHAHQRQISQTHLDPTSAPTPALVLRLVQGLENKGYTLWMDNYYNSPALARKLKTLGFDCVGTLRTNREFVPAELTVLSKSQMQPGQMSGFTSGDVDLLVWRDQNRVAAISTYHGNSACVVQGKLKPILIHDYNIMMGGVDKKDQMISMYPIERKRTKVWYKKLFRRLLNVSVLNAYIMSKGCRPSSNRTHREFRVSLINSIIEHHTEKDVVFPCEPRSRIFDARTHYMSEYPMYPQHKCRLRRQCVICKKKVTTYCVGCEKASCYPNCFIALHH